MKKVLVLVGVMVIGAVIGSALARSWIIRNVVQAAVEQGIGWPVEIGSARVSLWSSTVELKDVTVRNPDDFPDAAAFEVGRLFVRYRARTLVREVVELPEVVLHVNRATMVTREDGQTNLQRIAEKRHAPAGTRSAVAQPATPPEADVTPPAPAKKDKGTKRSRTAHIGQLTLILDEVEMQDYSRGGPEPVVRSYPVNLERTYTDVGDFEAIQADLGTALAVAMGPQLINDLLADHGVNLDDIGRTIADHDGDLEDLGRKLDAQTKDLQRELRRMLKPPKE